MLCSLDNPACAHDRRSLAKPSRLSLDDLRVRVRSDVFDKANVDVQSGQVTVDEKVWKGSDDVTRAAILFHELAHVEDPSRCEHCADERAGALMRMAGFGAVSTARAFSGLLSKDRGAMRSLGYGWKSADDRLRSFGIESDEQQMSIGAPASVEVNDGKAPPAKPESSSKLPIIVVIVAGIAIVAIWYGVAK